MLFNVNGAIGSGAYGVPEFATCGELLAHLDYLGVDRSLVWHVQARDTHPAWGNRLLLQAIDADEAARQRLIPALVATPAAAYEPGVLSEMLAVLDSGRSRALRLFPRMSRFPLRQIERVLREVAPLRPTVFIDVQGSMDHQDIGELAAVAAALPELPFVCTQMMWGAIGDMLDLMWRCPNVSVDTSWLHTRGAIELFCGEFGAERVLFGIGPRHHYGAAIAALNHACISDEERELVAHGNAERLLALQPPEKPLSREHPLLAEKPLWLSCREGRPLREVRIVDAHTHTGPHTRGWYLPDVELAENIPNLVAQMDRTGVDRMIIIPEHALFGEPVAGNRLAEAHLAPYQDRFSGYLVYNPYYQATLLPELDGFFARGFFVGFKILPSYWEIGLDDPRYQPVWEYAERFHLPILIHTWSCRYASPSLLTGIVRQYPHAVFLLGHSGGGGDRSCAEALASANDNVFLEFCGSFTSPVSWDETLGRVGNRKVVFGSDTGAHDQAWELGRLLSTPRPDAELIPILGTNVEAILAATCLPGR